MRLVSKPGTTLLELVIAICLLGLLVVGISSIDTFSRFQLRISDQRARIQNELAFLLEHMARHINSAVGFSNQVVDKQTSGDDVLLTVRVDNLSFTAGLGRNDSNDYDISYYFDSVGHNVTFTNATSPPEIVSTNIYSFDPYFNPSYDDNFIQVNVSACWDPTKTNCGVSIHNPAVNMSNRIEMPAVSTH